FQTCALPILKKQTAILLRRWPRGKNFEAWSFPFLGDDSAGTEHSEQRPLQSNFAAGWFVPFLKRVCAATVAACADGDGVDAERKDRQSVGGGAFGARCVRGVVVGGARRGE